MAWIEVHQTLQRHPKLLRLSAKLRVHRAQSAGHLLFLWLWSLDYAPTGDLSAFGPAEITAAAEYPGDAEIFAQALRETGWIEADGKLHDWYDYAGKLIEKREADRERKAESRRVPPVVHRTSGGHPPDGAGTVPNLTKPEDPPLPPKGGKRSRSAFLKPSVEEVAAYCLERKNGIDAAYWWDSYERTGWVVGKNRTPMVDWKAAVRTWENNRKGSSVPAASVSYSQPDFRGVE